MRIPTDFFQERNLVENVLGGNPSPMNSQNFEIIKGFITGNKMLQMNRTFMQLGGTVCTKIAIC